MKFDSIRENKNSGTIDWRIPKGLEADDFLQAYVENPRLHNSEILKLRGVSADEEIKSCSIRIFRLGWYGGSGARELYREQNLVLQKGKIWTKTEKPNEQFILDGPKWPFILEFEIPEEWADGLYIIKIETENLQSTLAPFWLTTPSEIEGITVCFSPINIHARNWWGGASATQVINGKTTKRKGLYHVIGREQVSMNRPMYSVRGGDFLRWAYPLVRFIERHEIPISYITDLDIEEYEIEKSSISHFVTVGPGRYWTQRFDKWVKEFVEIEAKSYAHLGSEAGQHIVTYDINSKQIRTQGQGCYERLENPITGARPSGSKPKPPWSPMKLNLPDTQEEHVIKGMIGSSWDISRNNSEVIGQGYGRHKFLNWRKAQTTRSRGTNVIFNAGVSNWTWALSAFGRQGNIVVNEIIQRLTLEILGVDPEILNSEVDLDMIRDEKEISDLSLEDLDKILSTKPDNFEALLHSGIRLFDQGRYHNAHIRFQRAHMINPKSTLCTYRFARNHHKLNNFKEMLPLYHELLRQHPNRFHYLQQYGALLLSLGKDDEGVRTLRYALSIRPDEPGPYVSLAHYHRQRNEFNSALQYIEQGIKISNTNSSALSEEAALYEKMGNFSIAANKWRNITIMYPENERAKMGYARSLYRDQQYDSAYNLMRELLDNEILRYVRECGHYCLNIAVNHIKNDEVIIDVCLLMLEKYAKEWQQSKNPHTPVTQIALALCRKEDFTQALSYIEKHENLFKNRSEFHLIKAQVYQEMGDYETFFSHANKSFSHNMPENACFTSTDQNNRLLVNHLRSECTKRVDGPLVSVIMTVYNYNPQLEKAINSVLRQSYHNLELIIIDDDSPDDVFELLLKIAEEDPRIVVHKMETNGGTYIAKNKGLEMAVGKYVAFHDSDDWVHPCKLEVSVVELEKNPNLVAVFSNYFRVDETGRIVFRGIGAVRPACISLTMRREEVLAGIGFFDAVRVSADSEYEYRIKSVFGEARVCFLETPYLIASVRSDSLSQGGRFALGWSGLSGVRLDYRKSYTEWHASTNFIQSCFISSDPNEPRKFYAPSEMLPW